jgi:hypothetical protein
LFNMTIPNLRNYGERQTPLCVAAILRPPDVVH